MKKQNRKSRRKRGPLWPSKPPEVIDSTSKEKKSMHLLDNEEQLILLYLDKLAEINQQHIDDCQNEMKKTKAEGMSKCFSKVLEVRILRDQEFSTQFNKVLGKAKAINLENLQRKSDYQDIILQYEQVSQNCSSIMEVNEKGIQLFEKYEQIRREEEIDKRAKNNLDNLVAHILYMKSEAAEMKTWPPVENVGVTLSPTLQLDDQQKRNTANKVSHVQLYMPVMNEVQDTEVVNELILKEPNEISVFSIEFDFIDDDISDMKKICDPEVEHLINISALENDLKREQSFEEIVEEDIIETNVKYEPNLQRPKVTYMEDFTYPSCVKIAKPIVIDYHEPKDVRMIEVMKINHRKRKKLKYDVTDLTYLQMDNYANDMVSFLVPIAILLWFLIMNFRPPDFTEDVQSKGIKVNEYMKNLAYLVMTLGCIFSLVI